MSTDNSFKWSFHISSGTQNIYCFCSASCIHAQHVSDGTDNTKHILFYLNELKAECGRSFSISNGKAPTEAAYLPHITTFDLKKYGNRSSFLAIAYAAFMQNSQLVWCMHLSPFFTALLQLEKACLEEICMFCWTTKIIINLWHQYSKSTLIHWCFSAFIVFFSSYSITASDTSLTRNR